MGGMVYEQNLLQFISHEEGRTRFDTESSNIVFNNDYFIRDHLGNVRMVLTDENKPAMYPAATMETAQAATEESIYSLNSTRADLPAGYPNNTPESNKLSKSQQSCGLHINGSRISVSLWVGSCARNESNRHYFPFRMHWLPVQIR